MVTLEFILNKVTSLKIFREKIWREWGKPSIPTANLIASVFTMAATFKEETEERGWKNKLRM